MIQLDDIQYGIDEVYKIEYLLSDVLICNIHSDFNLVDEDGVGVDHVGS